jgi:predicted small lipoprotein YifL
MSRFLKSLILLSLVAPLSGCGIKGGLKTPPPLWGADNTSGEDMADEQTEAPEAETEATSDDADFGYGVDVTRKP